MNIYLNSYLAPLNEVLDRPDVTDIYVNRPQEYWIETISGGMERYDAPGLDDVNLWRLARQIAAFSHQGISREHPLLSASLPNGARVQIIAPPATRGAIALAIRLHREQPLTLSDYFPADYSHGIEVRQFADDPTPAPPMQGEHPAAILADAVRSRKNILISGGTSSGKTSFLNALIQQIPQHERLIYIEDVSELRICHANAIGLIATRSQLGESGASSEDLLTASLRMRPDRILLGELRGREAYSFLRAVNSGHPGSMTTIHADSPERAVDQLTLLLLDEGSRLHREDVHFYVRNTIDLFVHLDREAGGRRLSRLVFNDRNC